MMNTTINHEDAQVAIAPLSVAQADQHNHLNGHSAPASQEVKDQKRAEERRKKKREANSQKQAQLEQQLKTRGVPRIETNNRQLIDKLVDLKNALVQYNSNRPVLFRGIGGLVEIGKDEENEPAIEGVSREALIGIASEAAIWTSTTQRDGIRNISPPRDLCEVFLSRPKYQAGLPKLERISTTPFLNEEGELCTVAGYYPRSSVYLSLAKDFRLPDTTPSPDNVAAAKNLIIDQLLGEVAFADDASRAHAVALMLLPFVQRVINDITPLHLFDAPVQSNGKTYAAQTCMAPFREAIPTTEKKSSEETRKSVIASLARGYGLLFIDNLRHNLNDPIINAAITVGKLEDRLIGTGKMITVSTRVVWVATSNNAQLDRDAASRSILIRLDANEENPEAREFKFEPLHFIAGNRSHVIGAILILIRNWQAKGCPEKSGKIRSRFKRWEKIMGGILEVNSIVGFLENIDQARDTLDPEAEAWREFVQAWHDTHEHKPVPAKELIEIARSCDSFVALLGEREGQNTRFGRMLLRKRDRVFANKKIQRADGHSGVAHWQVVELCPSIEPSE